MKKFGLIFLGLMVFFSCEKNQNQAIGERYFEIYAQREDLNAFKSFYNDTIEYENVILQTGLAPIATDELIVTNFSWNDKQMVYENGKILEVSSLISNDTLIVAHGRFMPYQYQGFQIPSMQFTTWLFLDDQKKIKKQIDWFNYPIEDIIQAYQMRQSLNIKAGQ